MIFSTIWYKLFSDIIFIYADAITTHTKNCGFNLVNQTNYLVILNLHIVLSYLKMVVVFA